MAKRGWLDGPRARRLDRGDGDAGIDGNDAILIGQHRIEIELSQSRGKSAASCASLTSRSAMAFTSAAGTSR